MDRSNDWSISWFNNWFLGCCSHWKKSYVRILLNNTIKFKRSLQSSIDSSSCKQSAEKIEQLNGFRTSESYDTRTIICLSTKLQANIVIFFVLFNTGPNQLNPHQVRIFFSLLKRVFCVCLWFVSSYQSYICTLLIKLCSLHLAQLFPQLKRLRGTLVKQKPWNLTRWYSLVKSALENGHKFTTSRFASPEKCTVLLLEARVSAAKWSGRRTRNPVDSRIRGPLRPLPGFVSR